MKRKVGALAVVALLAAGAWLLTTNLGRSADDNKGVQEDVLKLANEVGKSGKADPKKAAEIAKKNDELDAVMHQFKPPKKGGIALFPNGIEVELMKLSKTGKAKGADVVKAANVIEAIAEISKNYKDTSGKMDPKLWGKFAEDMQKTAKELEKAGKSGNAAQIKVAATNVSASCTNCHDKFR